MRPPLTPQQPVVHAHRVRRIATITLNFVVLALTHAGCSSPIVGIDAGRDIGADPTVDAADSAIQDVGGVDVFEQDVGGAVDASADASRGDVGADAGSSGSDWWFRDGSPVGGFPATDIGESFAAVARDPSGRVFVAGLAGGAVPSLPGTSTATADGAIVLAAFGPGGGMPLWSRAFGGLGFDTAWDITVGLSGDIYVGGTFEQSVDFGGGAVVPTGRSDGFLAAFSRDGERRWNVQLGGGRPDAFESILAVEATPGGDVVALGNYVGSALIGADSYSNPTANVSNVFVSWHDVDAGGLVSRSAAAIAATTQAEDLAVASDGTVYVVGDIGTTAAGVATATFGGVIVGDTDYNGFVAAFDSAGAGFGALTFTGGSVGTRRCTVALDDGDVLVSGSYTGGFSAGTVTVPAPAAAVQQAFLARVHWDSTPTVEWVGVVTAATGGVAVGTRVESRDDGRIVWAVTTQGPVSYSVVGGSATPLLPQHGTAVDASVITLDASGTLRAHRRFGTRTGGDATSPTRVLGLVLYGADSALISGATARETDAFPGEPSRAANIDPFLWNISAL
jgi:hypothetical protein